MVFTGPSVGCNYLDDQTSPYTFQDLPAAPGQTRTYQVRISARGRHRPLQPSAKPGLHTERHLIQIWPVTGSSD
ncbi:hypothetical protein ACRB68_01030 [Actinomadura sp. RB68]|uniref:Uncharacterized protein n=1 Tax=Actinomadura macrotermitis TaxID=2585200 RepID=A0A7K0BLX9_9ACTN|nr:hypothetical protein [Actinomadura macrotermitis]